MENLTDTTQGNPLGFANSGDTAHAATATATDEHEAPRLFLPDDLAFLDASNDVPLHLEQAAKMLLAFVQSEPEYDNPNPDFGRFTFTSYAQNAVQTRAAFRVCRLALDFLEADYLACEAEEIAHVREQLNTLELLRGQTA